MKPLARSGSRGRWPIIAVALSLTLTAPACSADPGMPQTSGISASTPTGPASTVSATGAIPTGQVQLDGGATLAVAPVNYDGVAVVSGRFTNHADHRPASLQREDGGNWVEVATGELDKGGAVDFLPPYVEGAVYRVVAAEFNFGGKVLLPVATAAVGADRHWRSVLSSDFNGDSIEAPWTYSITGSYKAGGRQCSAPYPSNVALEDGKVVLSVTKETNAGNIRRAKAAGCKEGKYYRNAMLTTESAFTMRTGTVAARVKFAQGQGMHGSVFALSPTLLSEIDMIESYGYGKGITSVAHLNGKQHPSAASGAAFVHKEPVKNRAWWAEYHVYSAQWTRSEVVFRIDGMVTTRLSRRDFDDTYFLFISMLSSDWELGRMKNPTRDAEGVEATTLPQSMSVDWVKAWEPRS